MLPPGEEFRARKSVKRDSGVFGGSISDEEGGIFDLYFALDALEMEVTGFCKGLDAGVFGVFEPAAGAFEKKDFKLFCFKVSVEAVSLDDIAAKRGFRS